MALQVNNPQVKIIINEKLFKRKRFVQIKVDGSNVGDGTKIVAVDSFARFPGPDVKP